MEDESHVFDYVRYLDLARVYVTSQSEGSRRSASNELYNYSERDVNFSSSLSRFLEKYKIKLDKEDEYIVHRVLGKISQTNWVGWRKWGKKCEVCSGLDREFAEPRLDASENEILKAIEVLKGLRTPDK